MRYWLVEANDRSGALWGFLVDAKHPTAPGVVKQLKALGTAVEISGQKVNVADLNLRTVKVRHDPTARLRVGHRYLLEGRTIGDA